MPDNSPDIHPITSILAGTPNGHYGPETAYLITAISRLCSESEIYAWWEKEIGWNGSPEVARKKSIDKYNQMVNPTGEGWQMGGINIENKNA